MDLGLMNTEVMRQWLYIDIGDWGKPDSTGFHWPFEGYIEK